MYIDSPQNAIQKVTGEVILKIQHRGGLRTNALGQGVDRRKTGAVI